MNPELVTIPMNGHVFYATKTQYDSENGCVEEYNARARSFDFGDGALFVRRCPLLLRPLNPDRPEDGFVSEGNPDQHELWNIQKCSLENSVQISALLFDAPHLSKAKASKFDSRKIIEFLQSLPVFPQLNLKFVAEDWLFFKITTGEKQLDQRQIDNIVRFNTEIFHCDSSSQELRAIKASYLKQQVFAIGSI